MDDDPYLESVVTLQPLALSLDEHKAQTYENFWSNRVNGSGVEPTEGYVDFPEKQFVTYWPGHRPVLRGVAYSRDAEHAQSGELIAPGPKRRAVSFALYRRTKEWDVLHMSKAHDWNRKMSRWHELKSQGKADADLYPIDRPYRPSPLTSSHGSDEVTVRIERKPVLQRSLSPEFISRFSPDSSEGSSSPGPDTLPIVAALDHISGSLEEALDDDDLPRPSEPARRRRSAPVTERPHLGLTFAKAATELGQIALADDSSGLVLDSFSSQNDQPRLSRAATSADLKEWKHLDALDLASDKGTTLEPLELQFYGKRSDPDRPQSPADADSKKIPLLTQPPPGGFDVVDEHNYVLTEPSHGQPARSSHEDYQEANSEGTISHSTPPIFSTQKNDQLPQQHKQDGISSTTNDWDSPIDWDEEYEYSKEGAMSSGDVASADNTKSNDSATRSSQLATQDSHFESIKPLEPNSKVDEDADSGQEIPSDAYPLLYAKFAVEDLANGYQSIIESVNPVEQIGDLGGSNNYFTHDLIACMLWRIGHTMDERDHRHSYYNTGLVKDVTKQLRRELNREKSEIKQELDRTSQARLELQNHVTQLAQEKESWTSEKDSLREEAKVHQQNLLKVVAEKKTSLREKTAQLNTMRGDSESLMKALQVMSQRNQQLQNDRQMFKSRMYSPLANDISPTRSVTVQTAERRSSSPSTKTNDGTAITVANPGEHMKRALECLAEARRLAIQTPT